jgi:Uncharacterized protein conserved in bacteria (DUF2252)
MTFVSDTRSYERWRASRIPIVAADLGAKHKLLAESPFVLLRGTYYRFAKQFYARARSLAAAPATVAVGDLHIENFGTWRDRDGRLAWGVNDFDEIDVLPYTLDLARLATSAVLAIRAEHLALPAHDACVAILAGWRERIDERVPVPFVLGERHRHLYRLASEALKQPASFARTINALPASSEPLPKAASRLLGEVTPWPGFAPALKTRTAGVGSLGSRRIVAVGELSGGLVVREAKQIPGAATRWLFPRRRPNRGLAGAVLDARAVAADPFRRQSAKWVLRPLAPDATRLDLGALRRVHDERAFLHSMGAEAANVHLTGHPSAAAAKALRRDADGRPGGWLHEAADKLAALTERDHAEWRARSK